MTRTFAFAGHVPVQDLINTGGAEDINVATDFFDSYSPLDRWSHTRRELLARGTFGYYERAPEDRSEEASSSFSEPRSEEAFLSPNVKTANPVFANTEKSGEERGVSWRTSLTGDEAQPDRSVPASEHDVLVVNNTVWRPLFGASTSADMIYSCVLATKPIRAGEEILNDYGQASYRRWFWFGQYGVVLPPPDGVRETPASVAETRHFFGHTGPG